VYGTAGWLSESKPVPRFYVHLLAALFVKFLQANPPLWVPFFLTQEVL
jgi:hypothetical protein